MQNEDKSNQENKITKKFTLEIISESGENFALEAIHNSDLSDRTGYDTTFLSIDLPLPIPSENILDSVAINPEPTENGDYFLDYTHFSVMFNKSQKLPFMTAVNIEGETNDLAIIHKKRKGDVWFQDHRIKSGDDTFQFNNDDYYKSGFQKGHMVRYYDPAWGDNELKKIAIGDTFHYTNCCPQIRGLNVGNWLDLEDYSMARAIFQDNKISVYTGPIFNKAKKIGKLLVPINYWKIIIYKKEDNLEALGFLLSHEIGFTKMIEENLLQETLSDEYSKPTLTKNDINRLFNEVNLKRWIVKISLLEEKTGIKFGLEDYDINKDESELFFTSISKDIKLINEILEIRKIMKVDDYTNDLEIIKNI